MQAKKWTHLLLARHQVGRGGFSRRVSTSRGCLWVSLKGAHHGDEEQPADLEHGGPEVEHRIIFQNSVASVVCTTSHSHLRHSKVHFEGMARTPSCHLLPVANGS